MENLENNSSRGNQVATSYLNQFNKKINDEESISPYKKLKLDVDEGLNPNDGLFDMGMLNDILDDIVGEAVGFSVNKSNQAKQKPNVSYILSEHLVRQCSRLDKVIFKISNVKLEIFLVK